MKNYNEMADDVLRRIGEYKSAQKNRRKKAAVISGAVCCGAIAVLAGIGIQKGGFFSIKNTSPEGENNHGAHIISSQESTVSTVPEKHPASESEDSQVSTPAENNTSALTGNYTLQGGTDSASAEPPRRWELYCNQITAKVSAAKRYFDPELYYEKAYTPEQMAEYFGRDFTKIDGLDYAGGYDNFKMTFANDGKIAYDTAVYAYNEGSVEVMLSKIGTPYDCLYQLESNNITTFKTKSGATVKVLAATDGKGFYLADFGYNGLNYRITAENSDSTEFEKIIENVIA